MKQKYPLRLGVILTAVIIGMSIFTIARTAMAGDTDSPAPVNPLADTRWRLVEFQSMDDATGTLRPDDPSKYRMELKADGSFTMKLNCNQISGTWSAVPSENKHGGRFTFGQITATQAVCPPPTMDEHIRTHARFIRSFVLEDDRLYLSLMADGGIYAWESDTDISRGKIIRAAPENGGPRNWEVAVKSGTLNLREKPSGSANVITAFTAGTILDNLGVIQVEGKTWCDVQELGGGPRGYVSAKYLKAATAPNGSVVTGPDDSALRAGQGLFDATGSIPCAQAPGQPTSMCEFGVARSGAGYATVIITRPDGRSRAIYFRMGVAIGVDTSQADGYPEFTATRESDLTIVRVGDERYEIPDAVILGG